MKVKYRIKSNQDFQKVIRDNKKNICGSFIIYHSNSSKPNARIGISTSKKLGNAVIRNRIRRQVRVMARNVIDLNGKLDYVIIVRKGYLNNNYQDNLEELKKTISKIKED